MGLEEGYCAGFIWIQDVAIIISHNQVQAKHSRKKGVFSWSSKKRTLHWRSQRIQSEGAQVLHKSRTAHWLFSFPSLSASHTTAM